MYICEKEKKKKYKCYTWQKMAIWKQIIILKKIEKNLSILNLLQIKIIFLILYFFLHIVIVLIIIFSLWKKKQKNKKKHHNHLEIL